MSSFFRASCFIFWLTWLLCFSFLVGTQKFVSEHVIVDDRLKLGLYIMNVACTANIVLAFVGCIFLKCDVHHICCAGLYMLCIIIVSPGVSIWGIQLTTRQTGNALPSLERTTEMVLAHLRDHGDVPHWLTFTEVEVKCCGLNGPQDYREWYRSLPTQQCTSQKFDVPETCCNSVQVSSDTSAENSNGNHDHVEIKTCDRNGTAWLEQLVTAGTANDTLTIEQKCDSTNNQTFQIDSNSSKNIYENGCYPSLRNFYRNMILCLYIFFIIITVFSFLMLFAYGRYFCKSPNITGERSNYSLDVETVSLLDLPALNTQEDDIITNYDPIKSNSNKEAM